MLLNSQNFCIKIPESRFRGLQEIDGVYQLQSRENLVGRLYSYLELDERFKLYIM